MSLIQIKNLTFAYEGGYDNVFENVSFQIDTDWKLGLVGRNGRGKTTLLRLLAGGLEYRGSIEASVTFDFFPFEIRDAKLSALDAIKSARGGIKLWELEREINLLETSPQILSRVYETLSGGEKTKLLLAALFAGGDERFLLIDEPTDHLDEEGRAVAAKYLQAKKGFVLVSHDRALLDGCVDHVLAINRGGIEVVGGNFSTWFEERMRKDSSELEENRRIKKEIKRLEKTAREKAEWSDKVEGTKIGSHSYDRGRVGHLAAKAMKRSKTIEKRVGRELDKKSSLLKNIEKSDGLKINFVSHHGKRLIEFRGVSVFYGEKAVCENVSFAVSQGERVAIKGPNGSGKSSLIKLILAQALRGPQNETGGLSHSGEIFTASGLKISVAPQETLHLSGNLSDYAASCGLDESLFKAILRKLEFARAQFDKNMRDFSSGQKKKVLIARCLCEASHIYIFDEPLNFVDVLSRYQIEEMILNSGPTMLFVEHDRVFAEKIATKAVRLK